MLQNNTDNYRLCLYTPPLRYSITCTSSMQCYCRAAIYAVLQGDDELGL